MQYFDAKFVASAAKVNDWPKSDLPEVVFTGRSNAGKSSLINTLVNRNNLAYSGKTPGKTRLLNFFSINQKYMFCDAPGYGYAHGGVNTALDFGRLMEPYFNYRESLKAMVIVLDVRRVPNDDDIRMVEYARASHIAIIAACTKCDKLSRNQMIQSMNVISKTLNIGKESLYPCSNIKKTGMEEIWQRIDEICYPSESH